MSLFEPHTNLRFISKPRKRFINLNNISSAASIIISYASQCINSLCLTLSSIVSDSTAEIDAHPGSVIAQVISPLAVL